MSLSSHRIGLLVVDPIANILDPIFGQDIECAMGFAQRRTEPAARLLTSARVDGIDNGLYQLFFLILGLTVDQGGIVVAVAHPFPAKLFAALDNTRVFGADV